MRLQWYIHACYDSVDDSAITVEESNKQVVLKNCPPFESCINEISNTRVVNVADLDVVIPM